MIIYETKWELIISKALKSQLEKSVHDLSLESQLIAIVGKTGL